MPLCDDFKTFIKILTGYCVSLKVLRFSSGKLFELLILGLGNFKFTDKSINRSFCTSFIFRKFIQSQNILSHLGASAGKKAIFNISFHLLGKANCCNFSRFSGTLFLTGQFI